jgi:hypothetical protein
MYENDDWRDLIASKYQQYRDSAQDPAIGSTMPSEPVDG